jgi:hypothetical protein
MTGRRHRQVAQALPSAAAVLTYAARIVIVQVQINAGSLDWRIKDYPHVLGRNFATVSWFNLRMTRRLLRMRNEKGHAIPIRGY